MSNITIDDELSRNPYATKNWNQCFKDNKEIPKSIKTILYEQALKIFPHYYKLWYTYLREKKHESNRFKPDHPIIEALVDFFDRSLVAINKMPRIWLEFMQHLIDQGLFNKTIKTINRALLALPITQHELIWPLYIKFIEHSDIPEYISERIYKRYLKLEPNKTEQYIDFLENKMYWGEAAQNILTILENQHLRPTECRTNYQSWLELCDIITKQPHQMKKLNVENIIRHGIRLFTDEIGRMWISLADFYVRKGSFERSRDIYEDGMASVITVRDFSMIFDGYSQFEEIIIRAKIDATTSKQTKTIGNQNKSFHNIDNDDIELRLAKLENLIERRPQLISSVILRQDPHNVFAWHRRIKIYSKDPVKQIQTYFEAITSVDPTKAKGKPHSLYCELASLYEKKSDLHNARIVFKKAVTQSYLWPADLSNIYCEWVEMELRNKNYNIGLAILRTLLGLSKDHSIQLSPKNKESFHLEKVMKSPKLWNLLCDLEESLGSYEGTKTSYYRMMEIGVCSPQTIVNFASFLSEKGYPDESFRVYERGIKLFRFPNSRCIWETYIEKFISWCNGTKIEMIRDLFEQVLKTAHSNDSIKFYLEYAKTEEKFGNSRRAMHIYERAAASSPPDLRLTMLEILLKKAKKYLGLTKIREIFEKAIHAKTVDKLEDNEIMKLCISYAQLELSIGEIDRVRAIYKYASQIHCKKGQKNIFDDWKHFEIKYGNLETFKEMLRLKRSVESSHPNIKNLITPVWGTPSESFEELEKAKRHKTLK